MVACGFTMLLIFLLAFYYNAHRVIEQKRWLLRIILFSLPLPWIAIETGWFVAEFGRQPWAIGEILPTFLGVSDLTVQDLYISLASFFIFYTILLIIEMYLMFKFARLGPSSLHTGKYHFENNSSAGGSGGSVLATQPQQPQE
jgi:cytochrome d ubiquinol oxidase subunit I